MITLDMLHHALHLPDFDPLQAQRLMAPVGRRMQPPDGLTPREAGVLALVFPEADDLQIVLTRRADTLRGHSGQVSFPGGRRDPQDETLTATALRETCEELGVCDPAVEVIGMLWPLYVPPSNFEVHPTVAWLPARPHFTPNPAEVAEVFTVPLSILLDEDSKASEDRVIQGTPIRIPYYHLQGHKVWGATAVMLGELESRLRAIIN
jgi:8-oxo-dGTP pyrophosphatase MutT (NUDIX family)